MEGSMRWGPRRIGTGGNAISFDDKLFGMGAKQRSSHVCRGRNIIQADENKNGLIRTTEGSVQIW